MGRKLAQNALSSYRTQDLVMPIRNLHLCPYLGMLTEFGQAHETAEKLIGASAADWVVRAVAFRQTGAGSENGVDEVATLSPEPITLVGKEGT